MTYHEWVERVSEELTVAGLFHHVEVKPGRHTLSRDIGGITRFGSLRDLAAALERADADLTYSAASGFTLFRRAAE